MAKDAETSKPKHLDPTSEYYLSSQANSDLQTYQFLMGLDDKYATLRTQIINMDPFPNIDRVYAMVMQEESHRGITGSRDTTLTVGFHAQNGPPTARSSGLVLAIAGDPDRTPTGQPWSTFCHQNAVGSSSGPLQASAAATQNNNPSLSQAQAAATSALPGLTPEQMQRLITFLESSPSGTNSLDRTSKSPIGLGKMHRRVFVFQPLSTATMIQPLSTATVAAISESESYELWHRRMGHPSSQPLIHLSTVSVVSPSLNTICDVCCRAKHSRTVFPDSTSCAMDIFGLVHCDIWGPYRKGGVFLSVLVYVDDLILAGNNSTACSSFKKYLNDCFKLKNLGPLKYFLGIEAARGPSGLFLSQRKYALDILYGSAKYALDILSESGLSASKPAAFPMEQNHSLALAGGPLLSDPGPYRRLIGHLVYLTITRPDICYAVHVLSQFMQSHRSQHWDAALRVLRYLKAAPGQGLFLPSDSPLQIYAFCDSDWASCPLTRRSVTGYFVSLGNSPISWRTKKQPTVSRSSAKAEYRSMVVTICELTWLKSFLLSLGVHHDRPMRLFCDN
ncbi:hypothetical protein RJ639_023297 [Escallonia herrerae]|uniref:Reverse transcriptase Ty1/copia-type domain-containing protein n=1 Tax=Escallonia herrerae TaxID=1293975 RepID=A0AA88V230_9ASTE|nr:hypothetical protein RJ639_023297 [Escallonia herrerae]